jgi:hypothetical protein
VVQRSAEDPLFRLGHVGWCWKEDGCLTGGWTTAGNAGLGRAWWRDHRSWRAAGAVVGHKDVCAQHACKHCMPVHEAPARCSVRLGHVLRSRLPPPCTSKQAMSDRSEQASKAKQSKRAASSKQVQAASSKQNKQQAESTTTIAHAEHSEQANARKRASKNASARQNAAPSAMQRERAFLADCFAYVLQHAATALSRLLQPLLRA